MEFIQAVTPFITQDEMEVRCFSKYAAELIGLYSATQP